MRQKSLLFSIILCGTVLASLIIFTKSAAAVNGQGFFNPQNNINLPSIDYGTNDVISGRTSGSSPDSIPSGIGNGDKQAFINFVKGKLTNGNSEQDKTGAAFIVWTMFKTSDMEKWLEENGHPDKIPYKMGPNDPIIPIWEAMIKQSDVTMTRTWANLNGRPISFYDPGTKDDFFATYSSGSREILRFQDSKGNSYDIETVCGNAVGSLGLPFPSEATLTPDAFVFTSDNPSNRVQDLNVARGAEVVFENIVKSNSTNTGDDRFRYVIDDVYSNINNEADRTDTEMIGPDGQNVQKIPANGNGSPAPNKASGWPKYYVIKIPDNARLDEKFCRRIKVFNYQNLDYLKIQPKEAYACVIVKITSVIPNTTADPVPIISGQVTNFTHTATTTAYSNPAKQYKWEVFEWTNLSANPYTKGTSTGTTNLATVTLNTNSYTASNPSVTKVCQSLKLSAINATDKSLSFGPDSSYCVAVTGNVDRNAKIMAQPDGNTNVEPEEKGSGSVWGSTDTGSVPQLNTNVKEWGYNHDATPAGATKTPEVERGVGAQQVNQQESSYGATYNQGPCFSAPTGPGGSYVCTTPRTYPNSYYTCPNGDRLSGDRCYFWEYKYTCEETGGTQYGWQRTPPTCNSWYDPAVCQDGRGGYWASPGGRACTDTWNCPRQGTMYPAGRGQPICEYRCEGGLGERAPLSTPSTMSSANGQIWQVYAGGDIHCYKPWKFQVDCTYSSSGTWRYWHTNSNGARIPPARTETADVVPGNVGSNYCTKTFEYFGEYVGDSGCVNISVKPSFTNGADGTPYIDNGSSDLRPGRLPNGTVALRWGVVAVQPSTATQCFNTVARPYISFNKTDVHALYPSGSGVIDTFGSWVNGNYYGSGVGYAAFATNGISGFKTYMTNSDQTKDRVFSNTAYNPGGNAGGNFGATMGKTYTDLRDAMINGPTVCPGGNTISDFSAYTTSTVIYCGGNTITITADKNNPWTVNSPSSVYIIAPAINISGNVTNLKSVSLIAGQLNTCYDGASGCGNKLYISGSISADRIYWQRAANSNIGSSVYCLRPTRPGDLPAGAFRSCDRYMNPGEVIDYSPEFSLSAPPYQPSSGPTVGKYDSIRSLPPIY